MYICSKCGEEKRKLLDTISEEGIVTICEDCIQNKDGPIVKKPFQGAFDDTNTKKSVYERLSSVAGINLSKFKKFGDIDEEKDLQDAELKEIVSKNLDVRFVKNIDVEVDLIRNFHWNIMRARRLKKITLSELAKKIAESEEILKMIERGDVSKSSVELISKLELFLGIVILTNEARKKLDSISKKISFDKVISRSLTIEDLKEVKKEEEAKPLIGNKGDYLEDLTPDEIDDLIFGRR